MAHSLSRRSTLGWLGGAAASAAVAAGALSACSVLPGSRSGAAPAPVSAGSGPSGAATGASASPTRLSRIAFGSCNDQSRPPVGWAALRALKPDFVLMGGDNVYASQQPFDVARLKAAYTQLAAQPDFVQLRHEVPHLAIWDDHDMGLNDGGAAFSGKAASREVFLDFWQVPQGDARRQRADGVYHAEIWGPPGQRVQLIGLDVRSFKSAWKPTDQRDAPGRERYLPDNAPGATLLGDAQWQWLEQQLRQPAEVRLLMSGIQVVVQGHGWEGWHLMPREQQRLLDLLDRTAAKGVVLLSGDRHVGALYRHNRGGKAYPLHEMTSSGLTHAWSQAREPGPNRLGELFTANHVGLIDIDWLGRVLALQIRDLAGSVQREVRIPFSQLGHTDLASTL
jgi:alkaline phosphatase D